MDAKKLISNKSICTLPWSGFELEPDGSVKNCVISKTKLGNINETGIKDILNCNTNIALKTSMLKDQKPFNCSGCYLQEKNRSNLSSISSRLYYLKELGTKIDLNYYDDVKNFSLKHVDLRWTNACNQACVYCGPAFSSKWAQELGVTIKSHKEARQEVTNYVFENVAQLENIYLAGGEPMLMKENLKFLTLLKDKNPECHIRVNTNLSTTSTGIFELLCSFKNVHWTVSVDSIKDEYNYIRHLGDWNEFLKNLEIIRRLDHKINFNMLHFILNYMSLFKCVDYFKNIGFHDNSFIIGPLYQPEHLNLLNLPEHMVARVITTIKHRLNQAPVGYLKNSYENLLTYYSTTKWKKDLPLFFAKTRVQDNRRGVDFRKIFTDLWGQLDVEALG
jgi:radical SAM protein with 4Fe4S-binding SPASM domain